MDFQTYIKIVRAINIGKHLPDAIYIHQLCFNDLPADLKSLLKKTLENHSIKSDSWNVLKLNKKKIGCSFLHYPGFFSEAFPELSDSIIIDIENGSVKKLKYHHSPNPPILHRKETLLPKNHPSIPEFEKLTTQAESENLFENKSTIGWKKAWGDLLKKKGLTIEGHQLIKIDPSIQKNKIDRHKTAIDRNSLSTPVQSLYRHNYLNDNYTFFDFGCGKGDDLNIVKELGVKASGWDPIYFSQSKLQEADIVNIGFVINIIESPTERIQTLKKAYSLSKKFLVASVMLGGDSLTNKFKPYGDGVITSRNTFQKYYTQNEFREYLEDSLNESAIAVGPGLFYIFKDKNEEQQFLIDRQRRRRNWKKISYKGSPDRLKIKLKAFYANHKDLLDDFWNTCLDFGRVPSNSEYSRTEEIKSICGSQPKAFKLVTEIHDKADFDEAESKRRNDLLVHFALGLFSRRKPYNTMPKILQKDINYFFNTYSDAIQEATNLLFSVGNTNTIKTECQKARKDLQTGRMDGDHSWTIHIDYINQLSPVLRTYIGCATQLYGDLYNVDLIKIHMQSNKISLMKYDDFENNPLPLLVERIKINLREQRIDFFQYGVKFKPQPLYLKSQYIEEGFPNFELQVLFDEKLKTMDFIDLDGFGPNLERFYITLAEKGVFIDGFTLLAKY